MRTAITFVVIGICVLGAGCQHVATTWSAEAKSPDGLWAATARSQQWGGPGTAYDATTVYLQRIKGPRLRRKFWCSLTNTRPWIWRWTCQLQRTWKWGMEWAPSPATT